MKAKRLWAERQKRSTKGLWNVVNETRGRLAKDPMSSLLQDYPSVSNFICDLTNIFRENFANDADDDLQPIDDSAWNFSVTPYDVFHKLIHLNPRKSMGPDAIPTKLLIIAAHVLCFPLSEIFNKSIQSKTFQALFKFAYVCPIPKQPRPSVQDFRPISILPVIAKVFERLVLNNVKSHLLNCYDKDQHAYRPDGSTTSALVSIMDRITKSLDESDTVAVRVTCLDLSKASVYTTP